MEDSFRFADELGPTKIVVIYEPRIPLKAVLVVDNVASGPSIGGLRMAPDVSTEECFRLARAMTLKNAAAGLPHGGGKSVIYGDPKMPLAQKQQLIRCFACAVREVHEYIVGPDMGTDEQCMAWIRDEIGRSVGLPREIGGIPLDEIGATGWGLCHATEVAIKHRGMKMKGLRIAVQGFGAVGKHAARFLCERGAVLVAASDSKGMVYDSDGLDVEALIDLKETGNSVADHSIGTGRDQDKLLDVECDVWIPAARPDVIREDNVERLNAKLVISGANIPVTEAAEKRLHEKGILCIPDFIANAGGVICAAMEYQGASESAAMQTIEEKLRRNTDQVLGITKERSISPREAAVDMAVERLTHAMNCRRWSVF